MAWNSPNTGRRYAIEGSVFVAGAAIQWLRDELGVMQTAEESNALASSVPNSAGVMFVPAFVGLGAPHWDAYARGTIVGLERGSTKAHLVRAALESVAFQTADVLDAIREDVGAPLRRLRVDGGAARNDFLMQFQADLLGIELERPRFTETTAMGAAYLAGLGAGMWTSLEEVGSLWKLDRRFTPSMSDDRREESRRRWNRALARARDWAEHS